MMRHSLSIVVRNSSRYEMALMAVRVPVNEKDKASVGRIDAASSFVIAVPECDKCVQVSGVLTRQGSDCCGCPCACTEPSTANPCWCSISKHKIISISPAYHISSSLPLYK